MIKIITTLALFAIAIAVPVAKAEPSLNADAVPVERHSPDVQDAAFAAHQPSRSARVSYGPLDPGIAAAIRMHRSAAVPAPTATGVNSDGFDWGDSGIGAGAMLALVFSLSSLRRGALIVRAKRSQALEA